MITKFETSSVGGESKGGSNTLLILLGVAVAGFLVYKFVLKPRMNKNEEEQ